MRLRWGDGDTYRLPEGEENDKLDAQHFQKRSMLGQVFPELNVELNEAERSSLLHLLFGIMNFLSDREKVHDMPNNKSNPLKKSAIKMSVGV